MRGAPALKNRYSRSRSRDYPANVTLGAQRAVWVGTLSTAFQQWNAGQGFPTRHTDGHMNEARPIID